MEPSEDKLAGFALGALLASDRDAASVRAQVPAAFHDRAVALLRAVGAHQDKRAALGALIGQVRPEHPIAATFPPSVRALLSAGRAGRAPANPDLTALLRRLSNLASARAAR